MDVARKENVDIGAKREGCASAQTPSGRPPRAGARRAPALDLDAALALGARDLSRATRRLILRRVIARALAPLKVCV